MRTADDFGKVRPKPREVENRRGDGTGVYVFRRGSDPPVDLAVPGQDQALRGR